VFIYIGLLVLNNQYLIQIKSLGYLNEKHMDLFVNGVNKIQKQVEK